MLGILLMNIRLFGMPYAAYFNPTAYGDLAGVNQFIFWFGAVMADQKFMTIFSAMNRPLKPINMPNKIASPL